MDTLCLKSGIHGITSPISVGGPLEVRSNSAQQQVTAAVGKSAGVAPPQKRASSGFFSFRYPLKSLWPGGGSWGSKRYKGIALEDAVLAESGEKGVVAGDADANANARGDNGTSSSSHTDGQKGNWVLKILHVTSLWKDREEMEQEQGQGLEKQMDAAVNGQPNDNREDVDEDEEECEACKINDDDEIEFDGDSFSRLLRKVSLAEAKLYAQMSYLGTLAYCIPKIKPGNLLKYRGLHFITSSIEKKELALKAEKDQMSSEKPEADRKIEDEAEGKEQKNNGYRISASSAYHIAASAASYLHYHTRSILPFSKTERGKDSPEMDNGSDDNTSIMDSDVASFMATTDSVTAVVAAKEEVKQAVADDLKSTRLSPCEWFICDDDQSATRFFVIQGLEVVVHRGIYEAAKGIYEQMLPEVHAHLKACGKHATFRFTGHSLGGSLSVLINLMLLIRGEVPASSLLPVITFGAPSIMCGGDHLLRKLGLPRSHVQSITLHRDIVPRAFSCNYPNHVAELLKAVNRNFRNHPCLNNQKLLYAPMGELLILQPDEKFSPHHPLLPSGSGLYFLNCSFLEMGDEAEKQLRAAQMVFLNSPHPLEILSDRSAYGSEGTIQRDHDMNSYLRSVQSVIRLELNRMRKAKRDHRRKFWWPLVLPHGTDAGGIIVGRPVASFNLGMGQDQFNFSGIVHAGRENLKRFGRLVASQHMHLLVVLMFPARLLLLGAYSVINFR
ncbi:hypothetical protein CISIN_1g004536mg [Citrus sinensis]|uniref:Fungal lipase-type domain-containing protein n=1 Tax=Citrus sinensis TaxID=2711 RepID=A0A067H591_CITSI|nr:hypothetical protein CISIN_1g004536mg [Citrus sinensis]